LNAFFAAFMEKKRRINGYANLDQSMLHMLKLCRIPSSASCGVKDGRWKYCSQWTGRSSVRVEQLDMKLGGLRHAMPSKQTIIGPDGQVTSVATYPVLRGS